MRKSISKMVSILLATSIFITGGPTIRINSSEIVNGSMKSNDAVIIGESEKNEEDGKNQDNYIEGEVIVMYYSGTVTKKSVTKKLNSSYYMKDSAVFKSVDKKTVSKMSGTNIDKKGDIMVSLIKSDTMSTKELMAELSKDKDFIAVEPNYRCRVEAADMRDFQWSLNNTGQLGGTAGCDINSDYEELVNNSEGKECVVAVVDTGIDYTHDDLKNMMWENPYSEEQLQGRHGYDFACNDDDVMDYSGHGTHCAGIIAADSENDIGIDGVNKFGIKLMSVKIFNDEGMGVDFAAVKAYEYIYKAMQLGTNIVAINNSWGGGDYSESEILYNLIDLVGEKGALTVFAAGNESLDCDKENYFPELNCSDYLVSVAASDMDDNLAPFSNYGKHTVNIAAPGENILSTVCYDCFNPITYNPEELKELTATYNSFDDSKELVQIMDENGFTDNVAGEDDVPYGLITKGDGEVHVSYSDEEFAGKSDNNKSLKISVENSSGLGEYKIYFPYELEASDTPIKASYFIRKMAKNKNVSVKVTDALWYKSGKIYEKKNLATINGDRWYFIEQEVLPSLDEPKKRCLCFTVVTQNVKDAEVYLDAVGVSKANVSSDRFGKYDWYSGTSMAAPHVTGAAAVLSQMYPDKTPLEIKVMLLGSARQKDSLKSKVATGGTLDFSNINDLKGYFEGIRVDKENKVIEVRGGLLLDDIKVFVNGLEKDSQQVSEVKRCIPLDDRLINHYYNIRVIKDNYTLQNLSGYYTVGKPYDRVYNESMLLFAKPWNIVLSTGNEIVYSHTLDLKKEIYYIFGKMGDNPDEPLTYSRGSSLKNSVLGLAEDDEQLKSKEAGSNAYFDGNVIRSLSLIKDGEKKLMWLGYNVEEKKWFVISEISGYYSISGEGKTFVYNGEVYLYFKGKEMKSDEYETEFLYKVKGDLRSDNYSVVPVHNSALALMVGKSYGNIYQIDDKLYSSVMENGRKIAYVIIYDGEKCYSKALGALNLKGQRITDPDWCYSSIKAAGVGIVRNGIIYAGVETDGYGDTFIYDAKSGNLKTTGYKLDTDSFHNEYGNLDVVLGTTVQDRLILNASPVWWTYPVSYYQLSIPVESGYINVKVGESENVKIIGERYYLPGDIVRLEFKAKYGKEVEKVEVNGKSAAYDASTKSFKYKCMSNDLANGTQVVITKKSGEKEILGEVANEKDVSLNIEGFQINTDYEGHRTVYTVSDPDKNVAKVGMLYGLADYAEESDMTLGTENKDVYSYYATENGKIDYNMNSENVQAYAMTMKFIKKKSYYNAPVMMRAFAILNDGTHVYSDIETTSVYDIACTLYNKRMMATDVQYEYLYNNILKLCNPEFPKIE